VQLFASGGFEDDNQDSGGDRGGTLALLAMWGFLFIVGSSMPTQPPVDKIGPASTMRVRAETGQLRTITRPETGPFATTKITEQPGPAPLPVAGVRAAPSPIPPRPLDRLQDPAQARVTSGPLDEAAGVIQPVAGARQGRTPRCDRNRTYDAETQSYRGYDGLTHPCRS
jgi:hypothetical protein